MSHDMTESKTRDIGVTASDLECTICLDLLAVPLVLPCGHVFCFECIYRHATTADKPRCPICKTSVTPATLNTMSPCWLLDAQVKKIGGTVADNEWKKRDATGRILFKSRCLDEDDLFVKAFAGDIETQTNLALAIYCTKPQQQSNFTCASFWYRKAAEKGFPTAQHDLGILYYKGEGVEQDYMKAVELFHRAAERGYSIAQFSLGVCYDEGKGVEQDGIKAVQWYRRAAEQEHSIAQHNLGSCYYKGMGVEQDYVKAMEWFRRAAERGNLQSKGALGTCYYNGKGVERDYVKAVEWFRRAAERGNLQSKSALGTCYYHGKGVDRDYVKAVEWYRRAADQGDSITQYRLGMCYREGKGVDRDDTQAKKWLQCAADQGHEQAKKELATMGGPK